jgi:hypothetical protein
VEHSGATHVFTVNNPRTEKHKKNIKTPQFLNVQSGDFGTLLEQMFHFFGPCPKTHFAIRLLKVVST